MYLLIYICQGSLVNVTSRPTLLRYYSQNITFICKNILSVKQILLECPTTTELFQKNGYGFNTCNNVRDILYNTDIIYSIVKLIVHSPVGKLV